MSTSAAIQTDLSPSWKQEVNRRLAAHRDRKGSSTAEPREPAEVRRAGSRAAEAAARVAARYAKAPSYSEMLAEEARAVRAAEAGAEAVSGAALQAQAAAESVLAGLETGLQAASGACGSAVVMESPQEPDALQVGASELTLRPACEAIVEPDEPSAASSSPKDSSGPKDSLSPKGQRPSFAIRWDADLPVRAADPAPFHATHGPDDFEVSVEDWWKSAQPAPLAWERADVEAIEVVEPSQPIHANLIEFPRELVAARKVRPRLVEGPYTGTGDSMGQLSIFEVDPGIETISTLPQAVEAVAAPLSPGSDWSSIQLDEEFIEEMAHDTGDDAVPAAAPLQAAPFGRRLMATSVDGALILGAFLAAAMVAMNNAKDLPNPHQIELGAAATLAALAVFYQVFFYTLAAATPGMRWARISLCGLDGERPTRGQRCGRLAALILSLLPVGLGVIWALFDEDHLTWHDRLSGTYVRRA